ncbi:nucleotidyltransferase domain-containing protein [Candidatus Bathyarchaeota archaeon]|nr:nucleotidyltransferase domain-containing protein [Candidatus Bathyarchaeota archaeon]
MWISRWLGECYSRLYVEFGQRLFTFSEAKDFLSFDEDRLAVAFSRLHSKRVMLIFDRGRPRLYRLLDPENFLFLASGVVKNVDKIASERYLKLVLDCLRVLLKTVDLESFAVYGSVARGSASKCSDVDVLLVSDSFEGSLGSRMEKLYHVEERLEEELKWLRRHGVYTSLSFYPLRRDEARRLPLLFLDLTEEAAILYDKNSFLEATLLNLKRGLLKHGARRVMVNEKHWYWDLKPDYRFGEKVEIA